MTALPVTQRIIYRLLSTFHPRRSLVALLVEGHQNVAPPNSAPYVYLKFKWKCFPHEIWYLLVQTKSGLQEAIPYLPINYSWGTLLELKLLTDSIILSKFYPSGILIPSAGSFSRFYLHEEIPDWRSWSPWEILVWTICSALLSVSNKVISPGFVTPTLSHTSFMSQ